MIINPSLFQDTPTPTDQSPTADPAVPSATSNQIKDVQRGTLNSIVGQMVENSGSSNDGLQAILDAILALPSA